MATLQRSQELALGIASTMQGRKAPDGLRGSVAAGSFDAVCEHHRAINILMEQRFVGSAFALLRPMFDGCIVGLWATYIASDELLERFGDGRFTPEPHKVIKQLKRHDDGSYTDTLHRIYDQAWKPLCSYTHGGRLQVSRRNAADFVGPNYTDDEVREVLTFSNAMAIIAAMEIPSLTSDQAFTDEMMKVVRKHVDARG